MNLENVCRNVIDIATEVGKFIQKEAKNFTLSQIEHKGINDLVSYVDREAERMLVEQLKELVHESGFITEENEKYKKLTDQPYHWVIDPLDGTTNFMHGLPIYAISIALMDHERVLLGLVYELNRDEVFYAVQGKGAYLNHQRMHVSGVEHLRDGLLATGFPYRDFAQVPAYLEIIRELLQKSHGVRRIGSASVDLAYVAAGRFEGFFEYNLNPWDVAAGALLVEEAGGIVSTFDGGRDFIFGKEILAACKVHPEILYLIQKHWFKT